MFLFHFFIQIKVFEPFSILGLEPGASDTEIKKAYRRLSIQYHPDKNPDPGLQYSKCVSINIIVYNCLFLQSKIVFFTSCCQRQTRILWNSFQRLTRRLQIPYPVKILKNMDILMGDR